MKKNVKAYVYDGRALKTLFMQLRNVIGIETTRKAITNICHEIVSNSDDATKYWVIHVFGKIINETGRYFNTLPNYAKGYYKDEFVKKNELEIFQIN